MLLLVISGLIGLSLPPETSIRSSLDVILLVFKLAWFIPLPFLAIYFWSFVSIKPEDLTLNAPDLTSSEVELTKKRVIYTTVTRGPNIDAVSGSVSSALYWIERVSKDYRLQYNHEVWVVTEEDAYGMWKAEYDRLERLGARILAIPQSFQTEHQTKFKARALQFAVEFRKRLEFNTSNDWVYHQDEETALGEDTVLGSLNFILNAETNRTLGAGVILYPKAWKNNVPSSEELARAPLYDFLYLYSMKEGSDTAAGYHGSHLLIRADIEDKIGWDFGPNTLTEDGVFVARAMQNGQTIGILKGFAYEQPPLTKRDLLKQRRRWIRGALNILKRHDVRRSDKLPILVGLLVWLSILPALLGFALTPIDFMGGQFTGMGFIMGLLGYSAFDIYFTGYELNRPYLTAYPRGLRGKFRLLLNCILGLVVDSLSPWYAILWRTSDYEVIKKGFRDSSS